MSKYQFILGKTKYYFIIYFFNSGYVYCVLFNSFMVHGCFVT